MRVMKGQARGVTAGIVRIIALVMAEKRPPGFV